MMSSDLLEPDDLADLKSTHSSQVNIHAVLVSLWNQGERLNSQQKEHRSSSKGYIWLHSSNPCKYLIK